MQIDVNRIFSSFLLLTILSILIERALSLFFEHQAISCVIRGKGLKELIALAVSWSVCYYWKIDTISSILNDESQNLGIFLTAATIAGGSKASIVLFQDVIGATKRNV